MAKGYVPIFFDWLDTTQDLSAEEKGNLIDAVVSYAAGFEYEHLLCGACKIAFRFLKGQVDRNAKIAEVRAKAGASKGKQNETNDNKTEQDESNFLNNNNNKNKNKNNNKEDVLGKPQKRFIPPTVEEVERYCDEKGIFGFDAQYFVDYYTARGWMIGKNKVKSWQACIRTWLRNDEKREAEKAQAYADLPY